MVNMLNNANVSIVTVIMFACWHQHKAPQPHRAAIGYHTLTWEQTQCHVQLVWYNWNTGVVYRYGTTNCAELVCWTMNKYMEKTTTTTKNYCELASWLMTDLLLNYSIEDDGGSWILMNCVSYVTNNLVNNLLIETEDLLRLLQNINIIYN